MSDKVSFLIDIVKEASKLINKNFEVKEKDTKGDLVTNIDYEVESFLINEIKKNYPDYAIVSEEFNSSHSLQDNCFVIDPIDSTIFFANKLPIWGIQVACITGGETCTAVIYLPDIHELYWANETGAYLNGKKIQVNDLNYDKGMYAILENSAYIGVVKMRNINKKCFNFGSSVDFAWTAAGRISATIVRKDNPWDYVPGEYLVKQAGGTIYNAPGCHIAANNEEFLNVLRANATYNPKEKVELVLEQNDF